MITKHKCHKCGQMANTYQGNHVSRLGIRFSAHNPYNGGELILQDAKSYCTGSYQLVYNVTLVPADNRN